MRGDFGKSILFLIKFSLEEFYILSTVLSEIRDGFLVTPRRPLEIYLDGKKTTKTRNKTALPSRNVSHFLNEVENCRVAASILVACKFVYGLDGTVR